MIFHLTVSLLTGLLHTPDAAEPPLISRHCRRRPPLGFHAIDAAATITPR